MSDHQDFVAICQILRKYFFLPHLFFSAPTQCTYWPFCGCTSCFSKLWVYSTFLSPLFTRPELALSNFLLFPRLKNSFRLRHLISDDEDIMHYGGSEANEKDRMPLCVKCISFFRPLKSRETRMQVHKKSIT